MKIRNESINKNYLIPSVITTLGIATVFGVGIYNAANIANTSNASALSYSTSKDISFTFAPTLSIGLSTDSLTIDNLVPGTTSDSNKVSVTVSSNTPYGYVLSAGVGSTVSTDPYYNTSDLVHDNTATEVPTTNKFSSISTTASLESLNTDNTWGYSTSTDGGTSWSTYSGLSHAETKPLLDISDPAQPSTIDFKIAARSASAQASGTYNNVITFYAVGKPYTPPIMQDTATIKAELQNVGDEMQAVDIRDNKTYWIRKMADGKIWMTQNLDLELDSNKTYTPADTDVSTNWQPTSSTIEFAGESVNNWNDSSNKPYSASPGELYIYSSGTTDDDSQYTSLITCQAVHPDCSAHNHVGNYYNWPAAVASNDASGMKTQYMQAPSSVCPTGWRLPTMRNSTGTTKSYEWGNFLVTGGVIDRIGSQIYVTNGFNIIRTSPLWLVRSGRVSRGSLGMIGYYGYYWSSTVSGQAYVYSLSFYSANIESASSVPSNMYIGRTVRCLVK